MVFKSVFENKKVFLTGHNGFKGSWLCTWLRLLGAEVFGYSLEPPSKPNMWDSIVNKSVIKSVNADIRDLTLLEKAIQDFDPDVVIHLAAQSLVRKSYCDPVETYSTNVMGTVNLFEAIRKRDKACIVVNVTSDKCYENKEWLWGYRETDPMGGHDPYSSSKGCSELVTSAYLRSFFGSNSQTSNKISLASARAGNVIGGGDFAEDRLIPDVVRAVAKGKQVQIRNPNSVRPWQHVLEPLGGYLLLISKMLADGQNYNSNWNFGPGESSTKSVAYVVNSFLEKWGLEAVFKQDDRAHPHEAGFLKLDCSKAYRILNWEPRLGIEQALEWTAIWYKAYQDDASDLQNLTEQQIRIYSQMIA